MPRISTITGLPAYLGSEEIEIEPFLPLHQRDPLQGIGHLHEIGTLGHELVPRIPEDPVSLDISLDSAIDFHLGLE